MHTSKKIIDCLTGETKAEGLTDAEALKRYEELGGKSMGYCIAADDEPVVQRDKPDERGWLF